MNQINEQAESALSKLLVRLGLTKSEQIAEEFYSSDKYLIAYLAERGVIEEKNAIKQVGEHLGVPVLTLEDAFDAEIIELFATDPIKNISRDCWRERKTVPVHLGNNGLLVAMANPLDRDTISFLEFELQLPIQVGIAREDEIVNILNSQFQIGGGLELKNILGTPFSHKIVNTSEPIQNNDSNVVRDDPTAAPIIRLVNKIFREAVYARASDVHITPEKDILAVKIRVDGVIRPLFSLPNEMKASLISRVKLLSGMNIAEKRLPQDGRLRLKTALGLRDLRISTVPSAYGENLVVRILSPDNIKMDFDFLGLTGETQKRYKKALRHTSCIHLVTGPTGSGKTSTLYASLLYLGDGTTNIITLEDPIEYRINRITQIQVNPKIGLTFAEGLRSILRQDPDIVLVGEIRDSETAEIAMRVAQTGHLVLSTLHTNTAVAAITRLRDLGIPSFLIASSLGSIMGQRLVRRLCQKCSIAADDTKRKQLEALGYASIKMKSAVGCNECSDTGYKGRIAFYSFLEIAPEIAEAIRLEAGEQEIERLGRKEGYLTLHESAEQLVVDGITSMEEVESVLGPREILENKHQGNDVSPVRKRILLVEDDENTAFVFSSLLKNGLYEVQTAKNGAEGLEMIYKETPDLIVSDIMMPVMSGFQMLQRLKSDAKTNKIPILMLTANATEENEVNHLALGANDFLSKTRSPDIFLARVERLLRHSR